MAISVGIATVAVGAYGAYNSKRAGDKAFGLASTQAGRQAYYNDLLMDLMKNPNKILSDPGYQLSMDQGIQAVARSNAAKGFLDSGNAAIELQQYGQSFASTYLRQQQQLLAGLSGANVNPAAAMSTGQQSYNDSFAQFGQVLASLGYTFGGTAGASSSSTGGGTFMGMPESSVPGGYVSEGGYIVNVPGD